MGVGDSNISPSRRMAIQIGPKAGEALRKLSAWRGQRGGPESLNLVFCLDQGDVLRPVSSAHCSLQPYAVCHQAFNDLSSLLSARTGQYIPAQEW